MQFLFNFTFTLLYFTLPYLTFTFTVVPKFSNNLSASVNCDFVLHFEYTQSSVVTSRITYLLASNRASVFFFMVFTFSPNILISSTQTRSCRVPFNFNPSSFSWTFLMAHSKPRLKSNDDKASPCFRPLRIRNASEKCSPMRT